MNGDAVPFFRIYKEGHLMVQDKDIRNFVDQLSKERNFFVVDIQNKKGKIKVIIDDYKGIKLDECIDVNREIRGFFEDQIDDYDLEVTSPGLNEPFKVFAQYEKNVGNKVEVLRKDGSQVTGKLVGAKPEQIEVEEKKRIKTDKKKKKTIHQQHTIAWNDIHHTKLIISF